MGRDARWLERFRATGGRTTDYVYGLDLIESVQGSSSSYYLTDGLGSTTGLTNGSGTVTDSYTYDVFGAPRTTSGTSTQPFRYTGEARDSVTGLYYLRARLYDPAAGRFLTQDAMEVPQRYVYAANNPVTLTDPSGLCPAGQIRAFGAPPPPAPVATPSPGGAGPIVGETRCFAPIGGSSERGWLSSAWGHTAEPVRAAISSDCTSSAYQIFVGTIQVSPILVGGAAFLLSSPVSAPAAAAVTGAAYGVSTAAGLGLSPEQILYRGPMNIGQGFQGISENC